MGQVLSGRRHGAAVNRSSGASLKHSSSAIAFAVAAGLAAPVLAGPITATWDGGVGNWATSNWSFDPSTGSTSPGNNGTDQYNVLIDGGKTGTASTVTLDTSTIIDSLQVDAGDSLIVEGASLTIVRDPSRPASGSVMNGGSITIEAQGAGVASLRLEGDVTFDGGGVLTLTGPAIEPVWAGDRVESLKSRTYIGSTGAMPTTLINENHTIEGSGDIGFFAMGIENRAGGLIDANVADAALVLAGRDPDTGQSGLLNTGTLRASDGGILRLFAGTYDQDDGTGQGTIEALAGSRIHIEDSFVTIDGGALRTAAGGELLVQDASIALNGVALSNAGTTTVDNAGFTVDEGAIENSGAMRFIGTSPVLKNLAVTNSGSITIEAQGLGFAGLRLEGDVTFEGGGALTLTGPAIAPVWSGDRAESLKSKNFIGPNGASPATLINQNHTIEGSGDIGFFAMGIENRAGGLIDANVADAALVLAGRDQTTGQAGLLNTGTLRASDGGILRLFAGTYDQDDGTDQGTIEALAGSRIHIEDSFVSVDGGALRTAGSGEFLVQDAAAVLNDLTFTNAGATTVDNASVTFNRTLVENSGVIAGQGSASVGLNDTDVRGGVLSMTADGRLFSTGNSSLDGVSVDGDFENFGTLAIGRDGAALTGRYTQTAGSTVLDGGTLGASFLDIQGGGLSGNGTIDGPAEIAGLVDAGFSAGILNFLGDTTFSGTINLEIGGILVDTGIPSPDRSNIGADPTGTEYDQYNVFGAAMLDSALGFSLSLIDDFDPAVGDFFDVLTADLLVADLDALDFMFPTLQDRAFIASIVSFDGRDALRVSVIGTAAQVPEPGVLPLFATGLLLLFVRHRRSRRRPAR